MSKLILRDASPLFSLVAIDALDLLLKLKMRVVLTDYLAWEATRSGSPTALRIAKLLADNAADKSVEVIDTEVGADRIRKEKAGIFDKRKDVGEDAIF